MGHEPILKRKLFLKNSSVLYRTKQLLKIEAFFPVAWICGISHSFPWLSPTLGQVTHALLTRAPLSSRRNFVRLACVKHAASVRSEPGSNSQIESLLSVAWRATEFYYFVLTARNRSFALPNPHSVILFLLSKSSPSSRLAKTVCILNEKECQAFLYKKN